MSRGEAHTIVVYTTPALRDLLEKDLIPTFRRETGERVAPVYVAAGQQYNRLRMSGPNPEADLFLHSSPLYLEKGAAEDRTAGVRLADESGLDAAFIGGGKDGDRAWYAFAWSPLVAVYPTSVEGSPDLATTEAGFGFPHPVLSNNGVWTVIFLEHLRADVGARILNQTVVQPTNARANIGGVADGSFDLTLGYEAVVRYYQKDGAAVDYDLPVVAGERVTTRVLFSVGLVKGERHPAADDFVRHLFTPESQAAVARRDFRPVVPGAPLPEGAVDLAGAEVFDFDWSRWEDLEATLVDYQVKS